MLKISPFFKSANRDFTLVEGDTMQVLSDFDFKFDMIFADPPYFLSNGGISVNCGKKVCVDKGEWDKGGTPEHIKEFNKQWISACKDKLKDDGTIWISGTYHNIFSVADVLSEEGFKILNVVTWAKTDPPDNLSHRVLTHSSEFIIWAKKSKRAYHKYNYEVMKQINDGKQMTDVWYMSAVQKWEKSCGKHPTQKPLPLLTRIILASTKENDWILDPFNGSGTTGIAASLLGRRYLGIDQEQNYLELSKQRREELDDEGIRRGYLEKVLADCHSAETAENPHKVLIGRVGSEEQWDWLMSSHMYNLPISKVISMPKLLSVDYVLVFLKNNERQTKLFKVSKIKPNVKSKEQIATLSDNNYHPQRDSSYWVVHLVENDLKLDGKGLYLKDIVPYTQNRGSYWIKSLDEIVNAYK